jgi:hypothetical protein
VTRRRIALTIRPDGTLLAATMNVHGPSCMSLLDPIGKLCPGAVVHDSQLTTDYHVTDEDLEVTVVREVEGDT